MFGERRAHEDWRRALGRRGAVYFVRCNVDTVVCFAVLPLVLSALSIYRSLS